MNLLRVFEWPNSESIVERLGWVLLHSLWQFSLVALLAGAVVRSLQRGSAAKRYALLVAALAVSVAAPLATWLLLPGDTQVAQASGAMTAPGGPTDALTNRRADATPLAGQLNMASGAIESGTSPNVTASRLPSDQLPAASTSPASSHVDSTWLEAAKSALQPWLPWIVIGWSLGVVICSLRPLLGWHTLWRLQLVGVSPVSDEVLAVMQRVSARLGLRHTVRVLQSTLAQVPVVVGYLRPVILLPVSLLTTIPAAQLEAILAHELAHVRRHDFVVNLLQTLIETLFFYHPAVWWLSRQIRIEREHCCDDLVVELLGNRVEYGRALVAIEELRGHSTVLALGAGDGSLLARVRRIVEGHSDNVVVRLNDRWPVALFSLGCLGTALVLSTTLSLAAKDGAEQESRPAIAELPGDITVELIGVGFHPSKDHEWWKPDGTKLEQRPILNGQFSVMPNSPEQVHYREFLIHIRGLPREHSVLTDYGGVSSATGSSYANGLWVGEHGAGPFKAKTTTIRLGLTTEPYGPTVTIDEAGRKQAAAEMPADLKPFYDRIAPIRVEELAGQTELLLEESACNELHKLAAWELRAIDTNGEKHRSSSESAAYLGKGRIALRHFAFKLPRDRIARFEYRLRPYRHWVTFENVSLQPGQKTDVKVKVESLAADRSAALKVTVSDPSQPDEQEGAKADARPHGPRNADAIDPIEGEVVDKLTGKRIEGATVRFRFRNIQRRSDWDDKPIAELVFRDVGQFTFRLPDGVDPQLGLTVERTAEHPDYQSLSPAGTYLLDVLNNNPTYARDFIRKVELSPGKVVTGQVLDLDGRPAVGIAVESGRNRQGWQNGCLHKTTTDAKGRYRLVVPADHGRGRIYVTPNHASAVSRAISTDFGEQPVFKLLRGTRLFGSVNDASGQGIAGGVVRANGGERIPWRYAVTDAQGRYSLPPCQYGTYSVELVDEGWIPELRKTGVRLPDVFLSQTVELSKTAPIEQVLDFNPTESVRVTADYTTSDDKSVSKGRLSLYGNVDHVDWSGSFREVPDTPGQYEIRVPRGLQGMFNSREYGHFLRIVRQATDDSPPAQQDITAFDRDGISFRVLRYKAASVTLRPVFEGKPVEITTYRYPEFADAKAARAIGAREANTGTHSWEPTAAGRWFDVHPDIDILLGLQLPGFQPWQKIVRIPEGENRVIDVVLEQLENTSRKTEPTAQGNQDTTAAVQRASQERIAEIVRPLLPSIVLVIRTNPATGRPEPNPNWQSGIVVDERGYILTIWPPDFGRANQITVRLVDQSEYVAEAVAIDKKLQLAVLRIRPRLPLTAVSLSRAQVPKAGDAVIGVPSPAQKAPLIGGVIAVSANPPTFPPNLIQSDLPLPIGETGSLMVTDKGEPAGIWWGIRAGKTRTSFAVPLQDALPLLANAVPQAASAPPKGLEFLAPYPKLHGLSLDMTEEQFLAIAEKQKLKPQKTSDGGSAQYRIATGDGHTVIVMFDKDNEKCKGIQRVRGEEPLQPENGDAKSDKAAADKPERADVKEPPAPAPPQLRVLNHDGAPATFNHVVEASIGRPDEKSRPWMEHRDRVGLVSLANLPAGTHWLVAAPEFATRTSFLLTTPLEQPVVEQRLLPQPAWDRDGKFSLEPVVADNPPANEEIVVTIRNTSEAVMSIGEEDLVLTMFPDSYRVLSPSVILPQEKRPRRLPIAAGASGVLRINWPHWVR